MGPEEDKLINLAVHKSSDPEMLRRDAESKTGSTPQEESSQQEMLGHDADIKTASHPEEEDREQPPEPDFDIAREDKLAERQINIANRQAG
jgi:hypothetical protein